MPLDPDEMPRVAGHAFDHNGLDARCCRADQNDKTLRCTMTRGVLFQAAEADIDKIDPSHGGYANGFAHYGRLTRAEFEQIQTEIGRHEKWAEVLMNAVREVSAA